METELRKAPVALVFWVAYLDFIVTTLTGGKEQKMGEARRELQ